jgi:hypothetical protein
LWSLTVVAKTPLLPLPLNVTAVDDSGNDDCSSTARARGEGRG